MQTDLVANPLRVGLVGTAYWGTRVAEAAAATQLVHITRCYSRTAPSRDAFAAKYHCRPASSYEELLADPSLEAIAVITPNSVHHVQIKLAFEHGKHVFVDKPLTATLQEGVDVVKAVRASGLVLGVDHECRWEAGARAMKRMLEGGALGRVLMAESNISTTTGMKIKPGEWRWSREECPGGPLLQIGIHHLDLLQYLLGPIVRVHGWQKHQVIDAPIDDTTVTLLEFANGVLGYHGSGYASARSAWIRVYGDAAVGIYDRHAGLSVSGAPLAGDSQSWNVAATKYEDPILPIRDALEDFARAVRSGGRAEVGARESLSALAVVLGAVRSQQTGATVEIAELLREAGADW